MLRSENPCDFLPDQLPLLFCSVVAQLLAAVLVVCLLVDNKHQL